MIGPRQREFRIFRAAQELLGQRVIAPAILREALNGEPDCGLWLTRDKNVATAWLRHRAGIPDTTLEELRGIATRVRHQAALN